MSKPLIEADQIEVKVKLKTILRNISFTICEGEAWAITGPAGSGKTTLANVIRHRQPISAGSLTSHLSSAAQVIMVEQQHTYRNQTDASSTYYQARFDSMDSVDFPSVEEELWKSIAKKGVELANNEVDDVLQLLQISHLRNSRLIQLSNGENKRFQLAKALLQQPKVLILDSPFIGLDQNARQILHQVINQLVSDQITVILITTPTEIPDSIIQVLELQKDGSVQIESRTSYVVSQRSEPADAAKIIDNTYQQLLKLKPSASDDSFDVAIKMQNVSVRYGGKTILDTVNWQVNRGEKWALSGPNGAGKSTLLSLIYGDNPQAYANQIYLFDRKRGSGETIWEIKGRIGYISPELHLYFNRRLPCFEAVASGLTDTLVSNKNLADEQKGSVEQWLDVFGLSSQQETLLIELPLSEQRLILLARALVKNPPVLLLDEPCQGLDDQQTQQFNAVVDTICRHFDKTLIYVSHYEQNVPACVNHRLFLEQGKASVI